jgi:tRNA A22 N-methylase
MAATLKKPFVYPNIGVFEDQAKLCYAEKYLVGNVLSAKTAIHSILSSGNQTFDNKEWLKKNSWEIHADRILSNVEQL